MTKILSHKIVQKIKVFVLAYKKISAAMAIVILLLGYWGIGSLGGNGAEFKYVLATAEKGTLVVSVSASGQVSASSQVDIKSTESYPQILTIIS